MYKLLIGITTFIITWYLMQYIYTPTPRSETSSILRTYEKQGCVRNPDFIPSNLVIWDDKIQFVPFDENWTEYKIVYFCP